MAWGKTKGKKAAKNQEPTAVEIANQYAILENEKGTDFPAREDQLNLTLDKKTVIDSQGNRMLYPVTCKLVAPEKRLMKPSKHNMNWVWWPLQRTLLI